MYDISNFSLRDMISCGADLRGLGTNATSLETAAGSVTRHLYESLGRSRDGERACALVRLFVTLPYSALTPDLQEFARHLVGSDEPHPTMKCLTLLGTAGDEPAWNSRATSMGHKALPLASEASVNRSPMISQLITQLGIPVGRLLSPDPGFLVDSEQHTFNVFHVPEAKGSPHIPAQEAFVVPYGIRSVLGFGGLLPSADLYAVILFAKEPIPRATADMFKTLALNVKLALLQFADKRVFA